MPDPAPLLWHFPISHYSEKVRWALDYKGVAHRRKVLSGDYLFRVRWATGRRATLPVLHLDGRAIVDSTTSALTLWKATSASRARSSESDFFASSFPTATRLGFAASSFAPSFIATSFGFCFAFGFGSAIGGLPSA